MEKYSSKQYFKPKYRHDVFANNAGYFSVIDNEKIGHISNKLGAGREKADDVIDFHAGIFVYKKINDMVEVGEIIYTLYSSNPIDLSLEKELLENTYFSYSKHKIDELIIEYRE